MYLSAFITRIFLSLLLFQVQQATRANDDSSLIRLRAQKRIPFLSDDHLTPEAISNTGLTTLASGDILIDKSGSGYEQRNQQPWLQQDPVGFLLTDCTTTGTTDHFDQSSLLPSSKHQRRQIQTPKACNSQWNTQQGQRKLQQSDEGQVREPGQTIPDVTHPGEPGEGEEGDETKPQEAVPSPRVGPYPSFLELNNLFHYGRKGNPNEICNELVAEGIPICAPLSIPPLESPAKVVVPSRFWSEADHCVRLVEEFWCCSFGTEYDPGRIIYNDQPWSSLNPLYKIPAAYPAAGWGCLRSDHPQGFRFP